MSLVPAHATAVTQSGQWRGWTKVRWCEQRQTGGGRQTGEQVATVRADVAIWRHGMLSHCLGVNAMEHSLRTHPRGATGWLGAAIAGQSGG